MRLVEWNCRMAFHKKLWLLEKLGADLAVVPECSENAIATSDEFISFLWKGHNPKKGLGIIAFNEWQLQLRDDLESLPWVIPFKAWHPEGLEFNALAVWTVENKSVSDLSYAKQITRLINTYSKEIKSENLSIIGDFNTSIQGPSKGPHQENLQLLDSLNLFSAYHTLNGLNHGDEEEMTLKWIGPGKKEYLYHCDFIFLPKKILDGGKSFIYKLWSGEHTKLSDHQPVVVDIQDKSLQ